MIVDSSALIEIIKGQPGNVACIQALADSVTNVMSAANYLEAGLVADNQTPIAPYDPLEQLVSEFRIEIVPVTIAQAQLARWAHRQYGRGTHNNAKARLNFGDCFAYALARERNEPLLYVGDDFAHTDIRSALTRA